MKAEVWLYTDTYDYDYDESYVELYIHIPETDLWFTDIGYYSEQITHSGFTKRFWENLGIENELTYLGEL